MRRVDFFISHASEDKDAFVRPLADKLATMGYAVWYDEYSLKPGDSLRESIDSGLRAARCCLVVLSPAFFRKRWTRWELDAIVARQLSADQTVLIPVWHDVTRDDILSHSPTLADIVALRAEQGVAAVARAVSRLMPGRKAVARRSRHQHRNVEFMQALVESVFDLARAICPSVHLVTLLRHSQATSRGGRRGHGPAVPNEVKVPLKMSLSGYAAIQGQTIVVDDAKALAPLQGSAQSLVAIPIFGSNDRVMMVLTISSSAVGTFDEVLMHKFTTVADLLALSLSGLPAWRISRRRLTRGST